jgi:predicted ATPase
MITRVDIHNYRCLRQVTVELAPLTVMVGPNSSGKSAFLDALNPNVSRNVLRPNAWQRDASATISVRLKGHDKDIAYWRCLPDAQRNPFTKTVSKGYEYLPLRLELEKLRQPNQVTEARRLNSDGGNLANVIASLTRSQQGELAQELCRLVPMFRELEARPGQGQAGTIRLTFQDRWNPSVWYEPHEVSDGTMLLLAFLWLQYQDPTPDLLAIEEPERGLHPYLLRELVDVLRRLSTGDLGSRAIQVIMATHSAELLEFLRPEEVRFMRRNEADGSVLVESAPTDSPDWEQAFQEYRNSLGSAWLAGGLGGVPGVA